MFYPKIIYYEKGIENYELGRKLLDQYNDVPKIEIENHNNIEELRKKQNSEFTKLKQYLIIGTRKTHKYVENHKVSDYLVPYTSSGCTAMCMYCYLVCNYNKCAYLRLFVNREEMLDKLIKTANKSEKELTFEIGSNSDLVLENTITHNLEWTIEKFGQNNRGYITFPTKFAYVDPLLNLKHNGRTIIRMSVNPEEIIQKVEFGTSRLKDRIEAINKLKNAGYKIGILIAPVILVENWKELYKELNFFIVKSTKISSFSLVSSISASFKYLDKSSSLFNFLSFLYNLNLKSSGVIALLISNSNASLPYFIMYSSGSKFSFNLIIFGVIFNSSINLSAEIVAFSPALSPSKQSIILSVIFFKRLTCSLVKAVPIVATQLSIPTILALITSINPSITIT